MAKKVKKNANRVNNIGANVNKIKANKKKKQNDQGKNKVAIIKDANEFKSKSKKNKNKLAKKFKQIPDKEKHQAVANLVKLNSVKVLDKKDKSQNVKTRFQIGNKKQRKTLKNSDILERKEHNTRMKNLNRSSSKTDKSSVKKVLKQKESKSMKHKRKGKRTNDNTTKFDSTSHKAKKQKTAQKRNHNSQTSASRHKLDIERLKKLVDVKEKETKGQKEAKDQKGNVKSQNLREQVVVKPKKMRNWKENMNPSSLRERMMTKLKASRFRYINESLYSSESSESKNYFKDDPDAFKAYHEGYKQQVGQWPLNPLDVIVNSIKKMSKIHIIADFGCGEAKLAASVPHKVHSFDFVSLNENVTVCDMAHTPLLTNGVDVVVFCLSLMGTNLKDYIIEANRVLKIDGVLKIAEVESRFDKVEDFIKAIESYGFKNTWKDLSHNLFYFLDFKKQKDIGSKRNKLPPITLSPCLYKKR